MRRVGGCAFDLAETGYEDLATLAYFRLGRGARVLSAFVTNGESGEDDLRGEYPMHHAGHCEKKRRRLSQPSMAGVLLEHAGHPCSAGNRGCPPEMARGHPANRLTRLILDTHPDVILVAGTGSVVQQARYGQSWKLN